MAEMKLVIAVLQDEDASRVMRALIQAGYRVTHVATTGGFMRRGVDTLMIGVEKDQVENVLQVIRDHVNSEADPSLRRGMIFVLPVEQFERV